METTVRLYSDQFSEYLHDARHSAIELRWTSATKSMTEEQFREDITRLAQMLESEKVRNALVDVTSFQHDNAPDFEDWRQANIIPRYNAAGVEKFAFILPAGAPGTVENGNAPAREGTATFATGYFTSRERAVAWFDE